MCTRLSSYITRLLDDKMLPLSSPAHSQHISVLLGAVTNEIVSRVLALLFSLLAFHIGIEPSLILHLCLTGLQIEKEIVTEKEKGINYKRNIKEKGINYKRKGY